MDARVETWLSRDPDPSTREELQKLVDAGDKEELERRFSGRLAFGTAGLRAVLGAGPMRMNSLVVRETTAGLGNYLLETVEDVKNRGVVVCYDGRRGSAEFCQGVAGTLAALGIPVHLFDREDPTPVCAFAVVKLGAAAGVMVTASHNPPEYNGYKVYWGNGAQIIPPHDSGIAEAIDEAAKNVLPWMEPADAKGQGLIHTLGDAMEKDYLGEVAKLSVSSDKDDRDTFDVAYTPLHGVGARMAEAALKQAGFTRCHTVPSQREPDGSFPTVRFPNPEEPGAMDAVMDLAEEHEAYLAIANDPDADRLAVAVRTPTGGYHMLTGNQIGILLGSYLLEAQSDPSSSVVATTVVSSRMLGEIAKARGAHYFDTLTGFKWIANGGLEAEKKGQQFVFGYEEALGYTVGPLVRDKDGISSLVAFVEMAHTLRQSGRSVFNRLEDLYREFGMYVTAQRSLAFDPNSGAPSPGDGLRKNPPKTIAGRKILETSDFRSGKRVDASGNESAINLPSSDVLMYRLEGDASVIVRPSGTEPKVKCYYELCHPMAEDADVETVMTEANGALEALVEGHQGELAG